MGFFLLVVGENINTRSIVRYFVATYEFIAVDDNKKSCNKATFLSGKNRNRTGKDKRKRII